MKQGEERVVVQETGPSRADCDRFLRQVVMHHHDGDFYPDPWAISRELAFTLVQTEAILFNLSARGWIAASPYGPERLRLTPRCWSLLRRLSDPLTALLDTVNEESRPDPWHPLDDSAVIRASRQIHALAAVTDSQLVGNST